MINKRAIPFNGEQLPIVGLGSWIQFDVGSSDAERKPLRKVLQLMKEKGGKLIDSSPMYGRSEEVIGDLTTEFNPAADFFYATKVWTSGREQGIRQIEESFQKMRRNTMDLMQIHNLVDWKTHLSTLRNWKYQEKIRYIGITHYSSSAHLQLEEIIKSEQIDFVQFNYSIGSRLAEQRLLPAALEKGVAVIINIPFDSGSLFKVVKDKALPEWCLENRIGSWGQFFLKYILSHPAVTCVIPGTSDPAHLIDNMEAGMGTLPDEKIRKKMVKHFESL